MCPPSRLRADTQVCPYKDTLFTTSDLSFPSILYFSFCTLHFAFKHYLPHAPGTIALRTSIKAMPPRTRAITFQLNWRCASGSRSPAPM